MKKRNLLFFVITLLVLIAIININAVTIPGSGSDTVNPETGTTKSMDEISGYGDKVINTNYSYLRKELFKNSDKNLFYQIMNSIGNILSTFDFYFNPIFGMPFSWSWAFLFSIIVWFILFIVILAPAFYLSDKTIISMIISFIITTIIGFAGIIKSAVKTLEIVITAWWIAIAAILIGLLVMIIYTGGIKELFSRIRKESKEEKLKRAEQNIKIAGENARRMNESYRA